MKGSGGASKGKELVRGLRFNSIKAFLHKFRNVTSVKVNATIYFLFNFCFTLPWSVLKRIKVQIKASLTKRSNRLIRFTSWKEITKGKWPGFYVLCVINESEPSKGTHVSERLLKIDLFKARVLLGDYGKEHEINWSLRDFDKHSSSCGAAGGDGVTDTVL